MTQLADHIGPHFENILDFIKNRKEFDWSKSVQLDNESSSSEMCNLFANVVIDDLLVADQPV